MGQTTSKQEGCATTNRSPMSESGPVGCLQSDPFTGSHHEALATWNGVEATMVESDSNGYKFELQIKLKLKKKKTEKQHAQLYLSSI